MNADKLKEAAEAFASSSLEKMKDVNVIKLSEQLHWCVNGNGHKIEIRICAHNLTKGAAHGTI
jgi:gamma-glutamyl:cysteine ligase YbdK (ATP-grasp superfamily)